MSMKTAYAVVCILGVLICATAAQATLTVTIVGTTPSDGVIADGETATILWRIESDGSGDYQVEVGGDGTAGSGTEVTSSNGSGDFTGTKNITTSIVAESDLTEGDGDYTIYCIATMGEETTNASTVIKLNNPPAAVTGLSLGRGDGKLFVNWNPSEDPDIAYYLIYYATHHGTTATDYDGSDASEGASPVDNGDATNGQLSGLTNDITYYVRVSAVDLTGIEGPLSSEGTQTPTKSMGFSEMQGDEGGCFIATAAFGSYDHQFVRNLRLLRDRILLRTDAGRGLVRAYYAISPPLAGWIAQRPVVRAVVRAVLKPIAVAARCEVEHPGAISMPVLALLGISLVYARRRRPVREH